jgi:hypothetical protein
VVHIERKIMTKAIGKHRAVGARSAQFRTLCGANPTKTTANEGLAYRRGEKGAKIALKRALKAS